MLEIIPQKVPIDVGHTFLLPTVAMVLTYKTENTIFDINDLSDALMKGKSNHSLSQTLPHFLQNLAGNSANDFALTFTPTIRLTKCILIEEFLTVATSHSPKTKT